jgi:pyruvate dehydrogenase E1 component alpha subunit
MKEVTQEVYLKWYEDMLLWRKFEDKLAALYIQQKSEAFYIYIMVKKRYCRCARNGLDKDRMITAYRITFNLSEWV